MRPALLLLLLCAPLRAERPNVLWITCEDTGTHLGCYGDPDADTPTLDALAARGVLYERCWSNAPVCAPARTAILTGRYPFRLGASPMRTRVPLAPELGVLPELLREAGYHCTNRSKTDYNVELSREVWDESSGDAHWRDRDPGQPFFAVVNLTTTHESRIRKRPHEPVHDPAGVHLPAYWPDHPDVRRDWAQYHDEVTEMDGQVAGWLAQLEEDGLADDTIVFFYGDHGSGMPRHKRWLYEGGLRVPLIVRVPERFAHLAPHAGGTRTDELVAFVDLMPTVLALAGVEAPEDLDGRAFLGPDPGPERRYLLGFRDRMDERVDLSRALCDGTWLYVRNYHPHRRRGEYLDYMYRTPATRAWRAAYEAGGLPPHQAAFFEPKRPEELYDLRADPDQVNDLAGDPEQAETLARLRRDLRARLLRVGDRGFLPESDLVRRSGEGAPTRVHPPLAVILAAAEAASDPASELEEGWFAHPDPAVRAWAATGLFVRGAGAVRARRAWLGERLADATPCVRVAAAEALGRYGDRAERAAALEVLVEHANLAEHDVRLVMEALNALDALDFGAWPVREAIAALPREADHVHPRMRNDVPKLLGRIVPELEPERRVFRTVDGRELDLFLFAPDAPAPPGDRPAAVFFHGGGWRSGEPSQLFDQAAALAARGMVACSARYRLGRDGYAPGDAVADAKAAVRWVRAHADELGVDPRRVAAGGGSAGGHLAAATALVEGFDGAPSGTVLSCRPDALLLFNPVVDNGPGGAGHERVGEDWRALSPLHNVRAPGPPTLLLLGTEDALVPVSTARAFAEELRAAGGRCDLALFEGGAHGWFNRGRGGYDETTGALLRFLDSLGWLE